MIWLFIVTVNSSPNEASNIGIIGGADGPTEIYITGEIYSYVLRAVVLITALALYVPVKNIL
ncbi:sodium ion-translocating decarboxylase subunit beta [Alkaliphilus crotonatoxidans]